MPNVLIRDLPKGVYEQLKNAAKLNQRSLNGEIVSRLQDSVKARRLPPEQFIEQMRQLRAGQTRQVSIEEIVAGIREDRDDPDR